MAETFNISELVPYKFRSISFSSITDGKVLARLTQIESPQLNTTTENDSVVDAIGTEIMKLYRSKKAQFTAQNSLFNLDLYATQLGTQKKVASSASKILSPAEERLKVANGKVTLANKPAGEFRYIYLLKQNNIYTILEKDTTASAGKFAINNTEISVETASVPDGSILWIPYEYESENAISIANYSDKFPEVVAFNASVIFKDPCTEKDILGFIVAKRAKIDPSSIELALTKDGKHPFTIDLFKPYCDEDGELYNFIICQ